MKREPVSFWWVWTKSGAQPRVFHESEDAAITEAQRLAVKNPGKKYIVLHAYAKFSVSE